ncbi:hypothetical protein [Lysinibacillus capsici]|uniref:hypothetical protein n=1 Tax=Lysinibacillus capsici TaxID=2115968 RepID=UPI00325FBA52
MKKKSITIILLITIGLFLIVLYASIIQVFGIQSDDKATIIGGVLSMIGGALGALGAYVVATYQMNKQIEHEKQKEKNREKRASYTI